jgi:hypothetical protein
MGGHSKTVLLDGSAFGWPGVAGGMAAPQVKNASLHNSAIGEVFAGKKGKTHEPKVKRVSRAESVVPLPPQKSSGASSHSHPLEAGILIIQFLLVKSTSLMSTTEI